LGFRACFNKDRRAGRLTRGVVKDILTRSAHYPHGSNVRLTDGQEGRAKIILGQVRRCGAPDKKMTDRLQSEKNSL